MTVTHADVKAAGERVADHVLRTPILEISPGVIFKLEQVQRSGSFKVRGAFNRILSAGTLPPTGVIAASGGNHGLAVAYAARALGVRAEIFVPTVTSPVKLAGLRALGAEITQTGAIYSAAAEAAAKRAAETGALPVHAYDQPEVIAGQGTLALELMEQAPGVDTVLVAVGGGGLASGVSLGLREGVKLVAVEPELIPGLHRALRAGHPVPVEVSGVGADALGATQVGGLAFGILSGAGVESVLVSDEAIIDARRRLWSEHRLVVEHAGAAAYAALLSGAYRPADGERVAVVLCGSNTDPATLTA
ncbi:threonine/serine dehydratase [Nonomuraea endophytica]|uniref:threonine ammonia-lyase n=1 Tax=Nonomuraea endophytica TaxID=714136 RepID=A0A7W8AA32_9ACTN|nr:threonine/serine dehydratase [Nonomuraea endophytica]MBB5082441.1 threonine dehydratase [Nonomuraea endophytica]